MRFGARTLLTIIVTVVAVFVVLTTINVNEIAAALRASDWRYSVLAYALGLMTLLGGALALVAFSPVKVPLWRATLVQTAGTFVALAAPAGIGPAALNLRTLTKRGVSATLAAATVALVQVTQFVVTVLLLLVLSLLSGTQQQSALPVSPVVLVVVAAVAGLVAAALLVPRVRQWALAKAMPTLRQTWPRFIQVIGQPTRLGLGLLGSTVMTMGYVLAFDASLAALGQNASLVKVAIVYLAGTTAGSLVPTPGGVGTVEAALTASLGAVVGLNPGVALSVAVLFRVLTYWLRIPLGWVAMRRLQKARRGSSRLPACGASRNGVHRSGRQPATRRRAATTMSQRCTPPVHGDAQRTVALRRWSSGGEVLVGDHCPRADPGRYASPLLHTRDRCGEGLEGRVDRFCCRSSLVHVTVLPVR